MIQFDILVTHELACSMTKEISIHSENPNPEKRPGHTLLQLFNPMALIRAFKDRSRTFIPTEILLSNEEICERVATLYFMVKQEGERTIKLEENKFCRIFINSQNDALEIRIGNKQKVAADRFYGLSGLETLVQVSFGLDGEVSSAVLGDLERQSLYMMGSGDYDTYGNVYGGPQFMKGVDRISTFTGEGSVSIPYTDDMKENALQVIFQPVNGIIWQQTEGKPVQKAKRSTDQRIDVEAVSPSPRELSSGE